MHRSGNCVPFAIARALVEPRNCRVPVRLLNPSPESVTLHPNSLKSVEFPPGVIASVPTQSTHVDADKTKLLWEIVEQSGSELGQEEKEQFFHPFGRECRYVQGRTTKLKHGHCYAY